MLKRTVSDLPFLIALRGTAKWVDALQVMRSTAKLLRGIHDPLPRELAVAGQLMTTQWALSLFVAEFVGNRQLCDDSEQRFLAKTLLNQCRKTNSEGLKQMLFRRFSTSGAVSLPQQIIFVTESSGWMSAMELVARNQSALHQTSVVEALFSSVVSGGRWELAASLYTSSHSYMRTRAFSIARLNGILAANGRWDLALHVLADVFAAGIITRSDLLPVFIPLVRNFCARGLWKDALHFSLAHGAMEHLRDCRRKDHAAPSPSLLPRSASTPRFTRHISALVYMLSQMDFYYHFHPQQLQGVCNIRAIDHGKQFNLRSAGYVHRHVSHIARHIDQSIVQTISGFKKYLQGPITQLTLNAPDDAILVVDTSFVIWCVVNRLPLDGFLSEIRRIYPHLENAPLRSFLCPFRVLMEASVLIERESSTTRSSREILNRLDRFLFGSKQFTVAALGTELSCGSFYVIQKMIGENDVNNPDRHILNVSIALQFETFRRRRHQNRQTSQEESNSFQDLGAFAFYHAQRAAGNKQGHVDPKLVLLTFDKGLAMNADRLGIMTYPNYQGEHSRSSRLGQL